MKNRIKFESAEFAFDNGVRIVWREGIRGYRYLVTRYKHGEVSKLHSTNLQPNIMNSKYYAYKHIVFNLQ